MKIVTMVPIKLKNERLPNKNIKPFFDGTSITQCLLRTLVQVKGIDEIYVYCSDESIRPHLVGKALFLKRPAHLDSSSATPQDIIYEFTKDIDADVYMVSHVTSPFVTKEHFEECINAVLLNGYDSAFTAETIQKLLWLDGRPYNFDPCNIPRTQELPLLYAEVSAAYVFKKEVFSNYKRRIGLHPYITILNGFETIDIDYPEDFLLADIVYRGILEGAYR